MTERPRILFVAMAHSVHTAHWLNLVAESGDYEVVLYSSLYMPRHPSLNTNIKVYYPVLWGGKYHENGRFYILRRIADLIRCRLTGMPSGSYHTAVAPLVQLIKNYKPRILHGLEFQHSCYLAREALQKLPADQKPGFGVTNWGSDIYHYRQYPRHMRRISAVLAAADFYTCECARDIDIAKSSGFKGIFWPVIPGCAGFNTALLEQIANAAPAPSQRSQIMIKGYQHFAGRALTTLAALKACVAEIRPYRLCLFSTSFRVKCAYRKFARQYGLQVEFIPNVSQRDMLTYYSHARCFIATTVSDGISTSVLEAMSVGCFPIQTDRACCQEWFAHGKTGFATSMENIASVTAAIKQALSDDTLVDNAAPINRATIMLRCDEKPIQKTLLSNYAAFC